MARSLAGLSLLMLGLLASQPGHAGDLIQVHNTATKEIGALVDGFRGHAPVNDARYVRLDLGGFFDAVFPVIPLDDFTLDASRNEIIAFARGRPPVLVSDVPWTALNDRIDVAFDEEYRIPVYIWIVQGPFEDVRLWAAGATVTTAMIWTQERTGIAFSDVEINDVTADATEPLLDFSCWADATAIKSLGHDPDGVNIYYVRTVDFGTGPGLGNGVWCGNARIIAMGRNTSHRLLAHELGHAFSLAHIDAQHFDTTNVMHPSSAVREYLSEGQNFRAVYNGASSINSIYDVRDGQAIRNCPHHYNDADRICPPVQKRIWADGPAWPPN
jgi:hypothetical protein